MWFAMRGYIVFLTVIAVATASQLTFENLDVEELLKNEHKKQAVFACLLDQAPCGDMQSLKDDISDLIKTKCSQCSPNLKRKYDNTRQILLEKYPDTMNALMLKYSSKN
ncbi:ejaculatory bulb-specific protein 3-like [Danaus plexippus]|uniref:ejaculatory bulb-specific protein 3-like n=1 Tax=Danaus plexippus TaxID=13037 RepID=UPI002AAFCD5B|nr:ejaculatory bulb-specific protein 3-like [Danaus plexippus]